MTTDPSTQQHNSHRLHRGKRPGSIDEVPTRARRRRPTHRKGVPTLTRARVGEAARELLSSGGPQAITMRKVAERLNVTPKALYGYIENRDDLVLLAVRTAFGTWPDVTLDVDNWDLSLRGFCAQLRVWIRANSGLIDFLQNSYNTYFSGSPRTDGGKATKNRLGVVDSGQESGPERAVMADWLNATSRGGVVTTTQAAVAEDTARPGESASSPYHPHYLQSIDDLAGFLFAIDLTPQQVDQITGQIIVTIIGFVKKYDEPNNGLSPEALQQRMRQGYEALSSMNSDLHLPNLRVLAQQTEHTNLDEFFERFITILIQGIRYYLALNSSN